MPKLGQLAGVPALALAVALPLFGKASGIPLEVVFPGAAGLVAMGSVDTSSGAILRFLS